jgi:hypothetical protein
VTRARALAAALAIAALAAAVVLHRAPMKITLANAALRIDDPWARALSFALAATAAVAVAAALPPRRAHRALLGACAAVLLVFAAESASARFEAGPEALAVRRWFVRTAVPWGEVTRVDARQDGVTIWASSGAAVDFDARRLTGEQRAILDRTLARRVREAPAGVQPEIR